MNIAIQGILGSFHDIAARRYFGDADLDMICCDTFEAVFDALRNDRPIGDSWPSKTPSPAACFTITNCCSRTPSPWWANTSCTLSTH